MPFNDQYGNRIDHVVDVICPIGEHLGGDDWQLSGAGFFISREGIALSAAHCFYKRNSQINNNNVTPKISHELYKIGTPTFSRMIPDGKDAVKIEMTQIQNVIMLPKVDIAIVLAGLKENKKRVNLTCRIPDIGETIYAYSFPNEQGNTNTITGKLALNTGEYEGIITNHYLEGRDPFLLPGPCVEAEMHSPGGTNGGPVFDKNGQVFGVISTGFNCQPPITYITPISTILNVEISLETDSGRREMSINDLANIGIISLMK